MGFPAYTQGFVDGFEHGIALAAHVSGINAPKLAAFGGESDQFLRFGIWRGRIFERGGNTDRAVFHGFAHQRFHLCKLLGRRLFVVVAQHDAADLRGADIAGQVDAHALLFEAGEILAEGSPVGSDVVVLVAGAICLNDSIVERRDGTAFAGNLGGDSLIDFRRQTRFDEDGEFGLAEHVDEAGRDDLAGGVNGALAGRGSKVADRGDFSLADADIAGIPRGTSAVDDVAVGDDKVETGWRLRH